MATIRLRKLICNTEKRHADAPIFVAEIIRLQLSVRIFNSI